MWYTYILRCGDNSLYTGITNDIDRRLKQHNSKIGGAYTRSRVPVYLEFKEYCESKNQALRREAQIKRWSKEKKELLIKGKLDELSAESHRHGKKVVKAL